jgi:hypothetical protein
MTADDKIKAAIVDPAAANAVHWPVRLIVTLAAVFLACAATVATVLIAQHNTITGMGDTIANLSNEASSNAAVSQRLAEQIRQLGATPVVQPATGPQGSTGATGPQGVPGRDGAQGPPGHDGAPGAQGTPGQDGAQGTPGVAGENGKNGSDGKDGAPGAQGPPGQDGTPGATGATGPQGQPGQPPASWTWTDHLGTEHVCTRDSGSPDSAPTYTCQP